MRYDLGDVATLRMTLRDQAGALIDATVALSIRAPDDTVTTPGHAHPTVGLYTADVALDRVGVWRWRWVATGAVQAAEAGALVVVEPWTGPLPWVPGLPEVADYVPERTQVSTVGAGDMLGTFTVETTPTDEQVQRLAAAAAAYVAARVGTVGPHLYDMARAAAAIRAAGMVELAYPRRNADVDTSGLLLAQAAAALDALDAANPSTDNPSDSPSPATGGPRGCFPAAQPWPDPALPSHLYLS